MTRTAPAAARAAAAAPGFRNPETLLMLMALAMPLAFSIWMAMLNNFSENLLGFTGEDIGAIQAIREIPGLLAVLVIYVLLFLREQTLALLSLLLLGLGVAATGFLPSFWGLALTTIISSVGFHYYEAVNQSLQLQWLSKERAPIVMGRLAGIGSSTAFLAFGAIFLVAHPETQGWLGLEEPPYTALYLIGGLATAAMAVAAMALFPHFKSETPQATRVVLKSRYWLYYTLVFLGGARRQIFVVFAAFMMVEKFDYGLSDFALLLLINHAVNTVFSPAMGRMVARFGERPMLTLEYSGLILVFLGYMIVDDPLTAAFLYIVNHLFFGLHFAQRTYFQKIADPEDMAPTASVAFTINHIAAVALPAPLGVLYLVAPSAVFGLGVGLAVASLLASRLVPPRPQKGDETLWRTTLAAVTPSKATR
ncbi:MAG: MFS transporter [Pseudomonadota bacterium]